MSRIHRIEVKGRHPQKACKSRRNDSARVKLQNHKARKPAREATKKSPRQRRTLRSLIVKLIFRTALAP
jgi:hypothetical protein